MKPPNYRLSKCCGSCYYVDEQDLFSGMPGTILVCKKFIIKTRDDVVVKSIFICDEYLERYEEKEYLTQVNK